MESLVLSIRNLSAKRDNKILFKNLNIDFHAGEVLQVLGANGTGKTTLLRILIGIYQDYQGEIAWSQNNICYLGHHQSIKNEFTLLENLLLDLKAMPVKKDKVMSALGIMQLSDKALRFAGHLSQGQRQRLSLAKLFLDDYSVWVLDEPFAALDSDGIKLMQDLVLQQVAAGGSVIFTSHQRFEISGLEFKFFDLKNNGDICT